MAARLIDQRGITLVEILAAVGILGIGLAALAAAIPLSAYGIQQGNQVSTATFLANQRLEQVRNAQWEAIGLTPPVDNLGLSASATAAPQAGGTTTFADEVPMATPYAGYSRGVRIFDCGSGAGCAGIVSDEMRQVVVTVTYTPLTGVGVSPTSQSAIVTMLVAKRR